MADFTLPDELMFNRGPIADAEAYAQERRCASWLCLTGDEFAAMEGGMSFAQVQAATPHTAQVVSDPPRTLDLALARRHVVALDALPRPTLVTCRKGPRSSAVAYMYAGLRGGAAPADVIAAGERDGAPFAAFDEYKAWVVEAIEALAQDPPALPWTVNYADGSANAYRLEATAGGVRFVYEPVTPERSSTGMYSGGDPIDTQLALDDPRLAAIWRHVAAVEADPSLHVAERHKGDGAFLVDSDGVTRRFMVVRRAILELDDLLEDLRRIP